MTHSCLYSIRMQASLSGKHVSGAERIAPLHLVNGIVGELLARGQGNGRLSDKISIKIDSLEGMKVRYQAALGVRSVKVPDPHAGRDSAGKIIRTFGVSDKAIERAIRHLSDGAAPGGYVMRGAVIMDAETGERLEPDKERGVRASRFDWTTEAYAAVKASLSAAGLTHHRTREALALATKIAHAPGVIAELCWSDDPDYAAGYVASLRSGYVRLSCMKKSGDPKGGRVIFVNSTIRLDALIMYLQEEPVLINEAGGQIQEVALNDLIG